MTVLGNALDILNIAQLYAPYSLFWDSVIFLIIFLGLTISVFGERFKKGKVIATGIALALTISMVMVEANTGWRIGSSELAILPLAILFILFFYLFYHMLSDVLGMPKNCAAAMAYFITLPGIYGLFSAPYLRLESQMPLFIAILEIFMIVALVQLIMCIGKLFPSGGATGNTNSSTGNGGSNSNQPSTPDNPRLTVYLAQPRNNHHFQVGQDIPIQGQVSGGTGDYVWEIFVQNRQRRGFVLPGRQTLTHSGRSATINWTLPDNIPPGQYNIVVRVRDGDSEANARVPFNIEPGSNNNLRVLIQNPVNASGHANPVHPYAIGNDVQVQGQIDGGAEPNIRWEAYLNGNRHAGARIGQGQGRTIDFTIPARLLPNHQPAHGNIGHHQIIVWATDNYEEAETNFQLNPVNQAPPQNLQQMINSFHSQLPLAMRSIGQLHNTYNTTLRIQFTVQYANADPNNLINQIQVTQRETDTLHDQLNVLQTLAQDIANHPDLQNLTAAQLQQYGDDMIDLTLALQNFHDYYQQFSHGFSTIAGAMP